ncbi:hypothetical protein RRF57_008212 [Xylaria bambusicola]|uniref:Uncharacterized protein n=1 Tax=Xylaria bambusicola TaxID=326684 RepID=A0AAN7ZB97_9PEZI
MNLTMAHHYEEHRLSSLDLHPDENVEVSRFEESSNGLLMEEIGVESQSRTQSSYEMLILTLSLAGLQSAYCSQFADGTDYLMSIGISPTVIASIWIIPPLCGATFQPLFGILSDALKVKLGRREPLLLLGGLGLLCALIIQAWSSTIANGLDGSCQGAWPACWIKVFVAILAVVMLYASAQAVQVATRAKMVDMCPASQQLRVNTLASRLISLTSVLYYILSYGLPPLMTVELRMQELALISAIIIVGTISIANVEGWESPPYSTSRAFSPRAPLGEGSYIQRVKDSVTARMFKILAVQFLSSFSWSHIYSSSAGTYQNPGRRDRHSPSFQAYHRERATGTIPTIYRAFDNDVCTPISSKPHRKRHLFVNQSLEVSLCWAATSMEAIASALLGVCCRYFVDKLYRLGTRARRLDWISWAVMQIIPYTMLTDEFLRNDGEPRSLSGLFLGINNLSMTIPQIIAGVICTTIFSTVSEKHTESMFNGMTGSLAIGSMVSLLATVVSFCIL